MAVRWSFLLVGSVLAAPIGRALAGPAVRDNTITAMTQLYDKEQVLGFIGNISTAMPGPRFTQNVVATQGVPAVSGYSSLVLDYKNALAKYFPGEAPDYTSLEGFGSASILIQALKQTTPLDTERLVETLESMRSLDLGLGTKLSFGRAEHQASHKIWGTSLDETGIYQAIELE